MDFIFVLIVCNLCVNSSDFLWNFWRTLSIFELWPCLVQPLGGDVTPRSREKEDKYNTLK